MVTNKKKGEKIPILEFLISVWPYTEVCSEIIKRVGLNKDRNYFIFIT